MNTLRNFLIGAGSAALLAAAATSASAQSPTTGTATMSANIQSPLTIATTNNMSFGTLVKPSAGSATVTLSDTGTVTYTGGVKAGTPSAAVFTVTAPAGTVITPSFTVSAPTSGLDITTLDSFAVTDTSNVSGTPITMSAGTQVLRYGAGFSLANTTPVGVYGGNLNISVSYQ